jgi:hypothetical protein
LLRGAVLAAYLIGLVGFPLYLGWQTWKQYREARLVDRLESSGLRVSAFHENRTPRSLRFEFTLDSINARFRHLRQISMDGPADAKTLAALRDCPLVGDLSLRLAPDDNDLAKVAETVNSLDRLGGGRTSLIVEGRRFTPRGIQSLVHDCRGAKFEIVLCDDEFAPTVLTYLCRVPSASGIQTWQTRGSVHADVHQLNLLGSKVYYFEPLP